MSFSLKYNILETECETLLEKAGKWKTPMRYNVALDANNVQMFTNPPTKHDIALAKNRAYHNGRLLTTTNRLKDKLAQRQKALKNNEQATLEN